jgi:hypothetical protein
VNVEDVRHPFVGRSGLQELFNQVTSGTCEPHLAEVLAWQLISINKNLTTEQRARFSALTGGRDLGDIARGIVEALDSKRQVAIAASTRQMGNRGASVHAVSQTMLHAALRPLRSNASLREAIVSVREQAGPT